MAILKRSLDDIKLIFSSLQTVRDVANLLEIKYSSLIYYIHNIHDTDKYTKFLIPKKSGGEREINAPIPPLRYIQKKLNFVFQNTILPHYCVYGFVANRNIVSNAKQHTKQQYVLNIDLKDFFPSINFGRTRGLFIAYPFNFNATVATFLAQICCCNNQLPQGAPTSPTVSNFICAKLDTQLLSFAKENNCRYTRYADDLTFSTYLPNFSDKIIVLNPGISKYSFRLSDGLKQIITGNGFAVNDRKIRLRRREQRQEVTGLIVNRFPNVNRKVIRQARAMIHAWEKFGLNNAEQEYFLRYDKTLRNLGVRKPSFLDIVRGKISFIGMVRGKSDLIYRKLCKKIKDLDPSLKMKIELDRNENIPLIVTEGSSDWKHLKAAFRYFKRAGNFTNLDLRFSEYVGGMGHTSLETVVKVKQTEIKSSKIIFIFDGDNEGIVDDVNDYQGNPRYWGNRVYSFSIPLPKHRDGQDGVCIELYYSDSEVKTTDNYGRCLFFNYEFDQGTREHLAGICRCKGKSGYKLIRKQVCILDSYDIENGNNIALSKNHFADQILAEKGNFKNFNFNAFLPIFERIEKIIHEVSHRQ